MDSKESGFWDGGKILPSDVDIKLLSKKVNKVAINK
jgi:hypothetical protein